MQKTIQKAAENYDTATILAHSYNTSETLTIQNDIYNAYYKLRDAYYDVYVALAKDGKYNSTFFKGYTQQQIQNFIQEHSPTGQGGTHEETTSQKMENLLNKYYAGDIDRYSAYKQYTVLSHDFATEQNKDNYLEYAYAANGREYTVSESTQFANYVKQYILSLYYNVASKLNTSYQTQGVEQEVMTFKRNFFGSKLGLITEYSQYVGGDYNKNYKGIFEKGNYYLSNISNPNVTAYTTSYSTGDGEPYIFMSGDYQDTFTFMHEFGHYVSEFTFGGVTSLDLAEVQSQGNELMFLSYLRDKNKLDSKIVKALAQYMIVNTLNSVIIGSAINELEQFTYVVDFDQTSLESKWDSIARAYGLGSGYDYLDYMYTVLLNYRGYYISYAVSAVAALQIFIKALNDLDDGKEAYLSICKKDSSNERFKKSLENADLYSVFSEDAFKSINTLSSKI